VLTFVSRTLAIQSESLPTEFRLFVKGWNETENGKFLFDDAAAASVMQAYKEWGVDLAIDLEHQMLDDASTDPTARDARGWCRLELRSDGSLWAVDVRWTPDGAARLQEKRQRYISPAFEIDPETKRVSKMINVAITAMPATHRTTALVAASKGSGMDPKLIMQALEAIEKGDSKSALDILKSLVASAAGAEGEPDGDEPGAEGDGAEGQPATEAVQDPKVVDNAAPPAGGDDDGDGDDDDDDAPPSSKDPKKAAKYTVRNALVATLKRETGTKTFAEALAVVADWKASHLTLEHERQKLATERATLESAERRKLCADLVKMGAEFPSTVWADDKATTIKSRWAKMPIAELRSHVAEQMAARGKGKQSSSRNIRPASGGQTVESVELSADEIAICEQMKCDPKTFAALKAVRDGKKA